MSDVQYECPDCGASAHIQPYREFKILPRVDCDNHHLHDDGKPRVMEPV